jgi:aldehyde:ferredoxin oxidoreductase
MGQLLKVNLNTQKIHTKKLEKNVQEKYLGGRGLGAYLYGKSPQEASSENNAVFIVPGILTGSDFPSSSRLEVVTSSPLTGYYTASSAGGNFGAFLRHNDIDALEITGKGTDWKYLVIENGKAVMRDATELVGWDIFETQESLRAHFPNKKVSIATIGPAGENLVNYATLLFDKRAAGRTGTGWHLGYKKLKAVVVVDRKPLTKAVNTEETQKLIKELLKAKIENDKTTATYATASFTEFSNDIQSYPASNYRRNFVSKDEIEGLGYEEYEGKGLEKSACWKCPLACTRTVETANGTKVKGPEYETIWALGANCDNFDMDTVIECNHLCDRFGLDTISTGGVLAWYKECIDRGLAEDTWSVERMKELIEEIAQKKNMGKKLAEGAVRAAQHLSYGAELIAHSKNLELPAWDPRTAIGMALAYATAPTGGDHCKAWTVMADTSNPETQFSPEGKAQGVIEKQNASALLDSLGTCMFADFMYGNEIWSKVLQVYSGIKLTAKQLENRGSDIFQLEWEINRKLGHNPTEITLPEKIIGYEIEVNGKKVILTKETLNTMVRDYITRRGW